MKETTTTKKIEEEQFEFCEVCRLNPNQGRRHNYFPKHKSSLSTLLTRFQTKLSDIKFFLRNPMPLRPEHATHNRICGNAIEHLASDDHMKRVKGFMWKYGGEMDRVDSFRITDVEFAKWEKKVQVLEDRS